MKFPEGWKLVPVEPTTEMVVAAFDAIPASLLDVKIRTHYRAMLAAAPHPPSAQAEPTIDINIKIAVPANWSNRLDMQWIVEREIHADRWSWSYAAPQPMNTQADAIEALRMALDALSCTGESHDPGHRCTHCDEYVDRNSVVRKLIRAALAAHGGKE